MYRIVLILVLITVAESQMSWCKQKSLGCGERKDGNVSWCAKNGHCGNGRGDKDGGISDKDNGNTDTDKDGNYIEPEKEKENRSDFKKVSDKLIEADKEAQKHCQGGIMEEVYGDEFYALIIDLGEIVPDDINVVLRHRVVSIKPLVGSELVKETIVVLPEIADAVNSKWIYRDGKVILIAPYKVKLGAKLKKDCKNNIVENVVVQPQADDKFAFDMRTL